MTVICYRDGIMAADTAIWQADIFVAETMKIIRTAAGELVACAGEKPDIEAFENWSRTGFASDLRPRETEDFGAIVVRRDGRISRFDCNMRGYDDTNFWAVEGCHAEFMSALMLAGYSAEAAVEMAIKHCAFAGGEVQVEKL